MANLTPQLILDRCPHCSVDQPSLHNVHQFESLDYRQANKRFWRVYKCSRCGGAVTAGSRAGWDMVVSEIYPTGRDVDSSLPDRAREYLEQALNSLHSPSGAVMLAASAVDAMLKARDYKAGSLYSRVDKAARDHVITADMAKWAHEVRLDANDQRHADEAAPLPTSDDATRAVDFAAALGEFMFALPARVRRGIDDAAAPA